MDVTGKVAIVTGGGGGIGGALAAALVDAGASVVVADLEESKAARVADPLGERAVAAGGDVSDPEVIAALIAQARDAFGPVDLYFANAGVPGPGYVETPEDVWSHTFDVNVMAHIRAARALVPEWLERGRGYFIATASAAGLLSQIGSAPYSVTKHAAVGFAEWLSITYGERGVSVSCLCPMGVNTDMLNAGLGDQPRLGASVVAAAGDIIEPDTVAAMVLDTIAAERFLVLPHAEVLEFMRRKTSDYDRWLGGMRRLQSRVDTAGEAIG